VRKDHDSSVRIGDGANISDSAIGAGAMVSTRLRRKPAIATLVSIVCAIVIGWITNYLYDWTAFVWHFFGHGQRGT
jgi:hypothetical protein